MGKWWKKEELPSETETDKLEFGAKKQYLHNFFYHFRWLAKKYFQARALS